MAEQKESCVNKQMRHARMHIPTLTFLQVG